MKRSNDSGQQGCHWDGIAQRATVLKGKSVEFGISHELLISRKRLFKMTLTITKKTIRAVFIPPQRNQSVLKLAMLVHHVFLQFSQFVENQDCDNSLKYKYL